MTSQPLRHPLPPDSSIPNLKDRLPKLEPRRPRPAAANPTACPETPALPPPPHPSIAAFQVPRRRILSKQDLDAFAASPTHKLLLAWVFSLADAVVDTPCSAIQDPDLSPVVNTLLAVLDEAEALVSRFPPSDQGGSRFGNKVFRDFLDALSQRLPAWHRDLGVADAAAAAEISTYLGQAFGNRNRIDYGSGHELNFVVWLLCLYQLALIPPSDFRALVLRVFPRYLSVMRVIQMTYYLEPAGSHGVWGLDDYQFLPFLFGASQLLHHPYITPRAVHQELTLEEFGADFMYLGQVSFVNSTKTVKGLRWHSPMLDDISSAKSWAKIDGGMRRMFVAEVLGKLPVMQHFLFGSLVPAVDGMSEETIAHGDDHGDSEETSCGPGGVHAHDGTGWGDACGIKVPSSIAAAQEQKKAGGSQTLRRIPFD